MIRTALLLGSIPVWLLLSCHSTSNRQPAQTQVLPNALSGIYQEEQVLEVSDLYAKDCASCHGHDLRGTEGGNALIGRRFQQKWADKTIGQLFQLTRASMPQSNPGMYDDETYANLIAFILNANRYPSGERRLPTKQDELDQLAFGPPSPVRVFERYFKPKPVDQGIETVEAEWDQHRGDYASTNYSPIDQINEENAHQLKIAWRWKSDNFGPQPEYYFKVTPLMVNGVLYFTAGRRRAVVAADARTGETLWTYTLNEGKRMAYTPRQNSGRGVAYWRSSTGNDRVVYITPGYQLVTLNAQSGKPVETFGNKGIVDLKVGLGVDPITATVGSTSPPIIVNDVIIMGACFPPGLAPRSKTETRGDIMGYDIRTGKQLWVFHTIPQEGEYGHETWENDAWQYTGNTGAWTPLTADPELGYVYIPLEAATGDFYGDIDQGITSFRKAWFASMSKPGKEYGIISLFIMTFGITTFPAHRYWLISWWMANL